MRVAGIRGRALTSPAAVVLADLADRREERKPLADRQRLGAPVRVDTGCLERGRDPCRLDGKLPREDVVEHRATLTETGLDEAPKGVLRLGIRQAIVARI